MRPIFGQFFLRATGEEAGLVPAAKSFAPPPTSARAFSRRPPFVAMAVTRLTRGFLFDPSADVPTLPPVALLLAILAGVASWRLTGKRLRFLAWPVDTLWVRVAAFVGAVSVAFSIADGAMNALDDAGSGYDFVPVAGLATEWPFDEVRNPMYCALLFVLLPGACVLLDSFWPIVFAPPLWAYLHGVVVAAEEELLWNAFGATYEAYAAKVPRWQVFGLWSAAMRRSSGAGAQGAEL
jgi:protein-S-isoprenylcysteine O-methyltransferase Ste14